MFQTLKNDVCSKLESIKSIKENLQQVEGISGVLKEKLSEGQVLLTRIPLELQNRHDYLQTNVNLRRDYENMLEKFFEWIHQAEKVLEVSGEGVDFDHIYAELDDLNV